MPSNRVHTAVNDGVATITVDNEPVNALSLKIRTGLVDAFARLASDTSVCAVVLTGNNGCFSAGADISEFGSDVGGPDLHDVATAMHATGVPVVAAIRGIALGGGLELALACDARCVAPDAGIGLPEAKIGLIPGAGGTQRLPRIVGIERALDLILEGREIDGAEAFKLGLAERLDDDVGAAAAKLALEMADGAVGVSTRNHTAEPNEAAIEAAKAGRVRRGFSPLARAKAIEAIEASARLPLAEGIALEAELFDDCANSAEAKALQYRFFAERQARKWPSSNTDSVDRQILTTAVVGAGTMGADIALAFVLKQIPVTLVDSNRGTLDKAIRRIHSGIDSAVAKGRLDEKGANNARLGLQTADSIDQVGKPDLAIEAVFESISVKKDVFSALDRVVAPNTILATNTSTLDIDAIAHATSRPEHVVGMHFFSPAHVMRLLEVVQGKRTRPDVIAASMRLGRHLGKATILAGNAWGFIGNCTFEPYVRECNRLLLEGASPAQVDRALTEFGMAMGMFAVADLSGNDVRAALIAEQAKQQSDAEREETKAVFAVLLRLVDHGRFGVKSGAGFYRYDGDARRAIPDPFVDDLIAETAADMKIARRKISDAEIIACCFDPLVNEGLRLVDQGIAQRASDIDVAWLNGFGYPATRGGPMYNAEAGGLAALTARLETASQRLAAPYFRPTPLLRRLVAENAKLADAARHVTRATS